MPDGSVISLRGAQVPDAAELVARSQAAFTVSSNFRQTWERERQVFLPDGAPFFFSNMTPGQRDRQTIVDTYPQFVARVAATFKFSSIINGDNDWVAVEATGHDGAKDPTTLAWAEQYRDALLGGLTDPSTGFLEQYFAMLLEREVYGNGRLYGGDRPGQLPIVRCSPMRDSAWEAGAGHEPDTHFWRQSLSAGEWAKKFPKAQLGETVMKAAESVTSRDRSFTFIHALLENPGWSPSEADQVPTKRRYLSVWLNEQEKVLVQAAWRNSRSYEAFRGRMRPGESYGREGGDEALEEALMAQRVRVAVIRSMEKAIDPVMLLPDDGVITPPTNEPEGAMVVKSELLTRANDPIRYMKSEGRPDLGMEFLRDGVYGSLDRAFGKDLYTLPREPRMLDGQIVGLQEEQSRGTVPLIVPLFAPTARFLGHIASIMGRQGRLPRPPQAAHKLTLSFKFKNPLERASRLAEVRAFMQAMSILVQAVQVDPGARHAIKVIEGVQYCARILGVPERLITPPKELAALLDADQKAAMQRMQLDQAKDMTTAVKNAGAGLSGFVQPQQLKEAA